ncbi:MAG: xanthine dehydrogenase family protein subunit M [Desulfomonile tiedjei]|uniref:Xanthine dehydrogenase family protein subunit M n=1 Tax=Desulfomonile tiedjei TaxID=2358 RepID=A0A9D6Z1Z0_9BACT|nr:xanthine dehydrogenase family protein subunit M [Desulfomonile tiedjei]
MTVFYRRLPKFDYVSPKTLSEAWELMQGTKGIDYQVFAGGTDVIPKLKRRQGQIPKCLIDIKGIQELDYIRYDANAGLAIGALASVYAVAHSCLVSEHHPALASAAGKIAAPQIQHRATVAGNICNAAPSADTAPALLVLDATVRCASVSGERSIPLKDFFTGPLQTALSDGEIVKEILVPRSSAGPSSCYFKLSPRRTLDLAVVGVAAFIRANNGKCDEIRIGLGSVGRTPLRAFSAESTLQNAKITEESIELAAKTAAEECWPRDSIRGSAAYRRAMVRVLVARAIKQCLSGKPLGTLC